MILHIERKFTAPTETFIANQINFQKKYRSIVFTVDHLNAVSINADVFESKNKHLLNSKILMQRQINEFSNLFEKHKPKLIHGHFLTDSAFFHPFSKKFNVPKVASGYGYDVSNFPKSFLGLGKQYFKNIFKEYNAFIAMSADMQKDMIKLGCPPEKVIIHYHGIDTTLFNVERAYRENEIFNILTIASLVPKKGHFTVLKALNIVRINYPQINFHYTVVGKGPLHQQLKIYIQETGLKDHVSFLGLIKHGDMLNDIIASADVFVHPSVTDAKGGKEGIPGAIVEAMASGLPVITTYHAGIPEIITNEVDGLLVKENDAAGVADLLYQLAKDINMRRQLGMNAKNTTLAKLDIRVKTKELIRIYEQL